MRSHNAKCAEAKLLVYKNSGVLKLIHNFLSTRIENTYQYLVSDKHEIIQLRMILRQPTS